VYGESAPADRRGTGGHFKGGQTGVYGTVTPGTSTGEYDAVYGFVGSGGQGVNYAVKGYVSGGSQTNYGVSGAAIGTGTNYGVYGYADGGTNYAGYFYGNVQVTGTLSKGAGSFKIDHPLDPEHKYLQHSFVESPDMMNIYNGNATLDEDGRAVIHLPGYFEALNRDFRYQLTCIGGFAPVYVETKIANGKFSIAGGAPGLEVSWQVTGIRHDRYAETNRIAVEIEKPATEQGSYIHPEAYQMPEEKGVDYLRGIRATDASVPEIDQGQQ